MVRNISGQTYKVQNQAAAPVRDHLTALPVELIDQVASHLAVRDYLNLSKSHSLFLNWLSPNKIWQRHHALRRPVPPQSKGSGNWRTDFSNLTLAQRIFVREAEHKVNINARVCDFEASRVPLKLAESIEKCFAFAALKLGSDIVKSGRERRIFEVSQSLQEFEEPESSGLTNSPSFTADGKNSVVNIDQLAGVKIEVGEFETIIARGAGHQAVIYTQIKLLRWALDRADVLAKQSHQFICSDPFIYFDARGESDEDSDSDDEVENAIEFNFPRVSENFFEAARFLSQRIGLGSLELEAIEFSWCFAQGALIWLLNHATNGDPDGIYDQAEKKLKRAESLSHKLGVGFGPGVYRQLATESLINLEKTATEVDPEHMYNRVRLAHYCSAKTNKPVPREIFSKTYERLRRGLLTASRDDGVLFGDMVPRIEKKMAHCSEMAGIDLKCLIGAKSKDTKTPTE